MMFFFGFAIDALFYHARKKRSHIKYFVQTDYFRSFVHRRTSYNVYYANFFEIRIISTRLYEPLLVLMAKVRTIWLCWLSEKILIIWPYELLGGNLYKIKISLICFDLRIQAALRFFLVNL